MFDTEARTYVDTHTHVKQRGKTKRSRFQPTRIPSIQKFQRFIVWKQQKIEMTREWLWKKKSSTYSHHNYKYISRHEFVTTKHWTEQKMPRKEIYSKNYYLHACERAVHAPQHGRMQHEGARQVQSNDCIQTIQGHFILRRQLMDGEWGAEKIKKKLKYLSLSSFHVRSFFCYLFEYYIP